MFTDCTFYGVTRFIRLDDEGNEVVVAEVDFGEKGVKLDGTVSLADILRLAAEVK